MATRYMASDITRYGAGWLFSGSGLYKKLQQMQSGELSVAAHSQTTATGTFPVEYDTAPLPVFTPTANPSGAYWISSVTTTGFVVTFASSPAGADKSFPYKVGNWVSLL
jgi:hypothetical protein